MVCTRAASAVMLASICSARVQDALPGVRDAPSAAGTRDSPKDINSCTSPEQSVVKRRLQQSDHGCTAPRGTSALRCWRTAVAVSLQMVAVACTPGASVTAQGPNFALALQNTYTPALRAFGFHVVTTGRALCFAWRALQVASRGWQARHSCSPGLLAS